MTDPWSLALAALAYLLAGRYWWRKMMLPGPSMPVDALFEDERQTDLFLWRCQASADEKRGALSVLVPKAIFLVLWPLALLVAAIAALCQRAAARFRE